jgi:hypothetical protein
MKRRFLLKVELVVVWGTGVERELREHDRQHLIALPLLSLFLGARRGHKVFLKLLFSSEGFFTFTNKKRGRKKASGPRLRSSSPRSPSLPLNHPPRPRSSRLRPRIFSARLQETYSHSPRFHLVSWPRCSLHSVLPCRAHSSSPPCPDWLNLVVDERQTCGLL